MFSLFCRRRNERLREEIDSNLGLTPKPLFRLIHPSVQEIGPRAGCRPGHKTSAGAEGTTMLPQGAHTHLPMTASPIRGGATFPL